MFNEVLFHSDAFAFFGEDVNPISCVVDAELSAKQAQVALADEYGLPPRAFDHVDTVEAADPEAAGMVEHRDYAGVWV